MHRSRSRKKFGCLRCVGKWRKHSSPDSRSPKGVRAVLKALTTLMREAMRGWRTGRVTIKWCSTNLFQEQWSLKNELILTPEELIKFNNLNESGFCHTSIIDPALVDRTCMTKEFNDILIPLVWEVFGEYLKLGIEVPTKEFLCTLKLTHNISHVWARV